MKEVCDHCGEASEDHYEVRATKRRDDYGFSKESVDILICPTAIYERVYRAEGEEPASVLTDSERRIAGHVIGALKKGLGKS